MSEFGPFSVDPRKVTDLGAANFAPVITRLIAAEVARAGMSGTTLEATTLQNAPDGGVDVGLRRAVQTRWIPAGDSAWQFKAGDLPPAKCKSELSGATEALDVLRRGGKYRLVLGASLPPPQLARRRLALVEEAEKLGIAFGDDTFEVIGADALASWAEEHPSLAINPLLGGIGTSGLTFDAWAQSNRHMTEWVPSSKRDAVIQQLRDVIATGSQLDVHVEGVSGVGKTRLVLEALRGYPYQELVVYVPAADQFSAPLMSHITRDGRTAIVVIDECDRRQHEIFAGVLATGSTARLITIGEVAATSALRSPMVGLEGLEDEAMSSLLQANAPNLWPEARRVVVQVAAGNVDYALKAARAIDRNSVSAADLISGDDVRSYIASELPEGELFLACTALALFSRFGYDRDVASEIEVIASGLSIPTLTLRTAARALGDLGLISKQGRYRSVSPHPLAVYLASKAWEEFGDSLISRLAPTLEADMLERLFRRAADIGEFDITSRAVRQLIDVSDGPLQSLEVLKAGNARLLPHYAVMAPVFVADRLGEMLESASDEDISRLGPLRRNLIWALEKLAWHSRTFERAADSLLRLSTEETETWANNSTGTWVNLFGTMLPGTAASPKARINYLATIAASTDKRERKLVVRALEKALHSHESIVVSAEVQGGVVVEPRGTPATYAEAWEYQNSAIDILRDLANDPDAAVAENATKVLAGAIHPTLEIEAVRARLGAALATLSPARLLRVRSEISGLRALFDRVDTEEVMARKSALDNLEALLPAASPEERLRVLAGTRAWDVERGELRERIVATAQVLRDPVRSLIELLDGPEEIEASFDIGWAIAQLSDGVSRLPELQARIEGPNLPALIGYLWARVHGGDESAFDDFIDERTFAPMQALSIITRGNRTKRAEARVMLLLRQVSVAQGARALFGWLREAGEDTLLKLVEDWGARIEDQDDYNSVVDFLAQQLYRRAEPLAQLDPAIRTLLERRREFPAIGQQSHDWSSLAHRLVESDPVGLVTMCADLMEADAASVFSSSEEVRLLRRAVSAGGVEAWEAVIGRIHDGSWRLAMAGRGWLGEAVEIPELSSWVCGDVERARTLASVASVDGPEMPETARFLINEFGSDKRVSSSLVGAFVSGSWVGNESDRIAGQIELLRSWIESGETSAAVRRWVLSLVSGLESERASSLEREEERDW